MLKLNWKVKHNKAFKRDSQRVVILVQVLVFVFTVVNSSLLVARCCPLTRRYVSFRNLSF
ncbi:DUF3265 domain-containing protein [Vibrio vulnificus]|nr:DUF3265 domain-containing protein [Vibrio vulnificus]